jgi:hypothetical protein
MNYGNETSSPSIKEDGCGVLDDKNTPVLKGQIDYLKSQYLSKDEVLYEARDLYSRWPKLKREEKRQVIETITEKIIIGKKDITINLCYIPSPSKTTAERERSRQVLFPFCQIQLKAQKPPKDWYGKALYRQQMRTIGATIKQSRLKLEVSQAAVAKRLNVRVTCRIGNTAEQYPIFAICQR